ncbi:MAG: hypothetical protein H6855_03690 [Rhodospirillales bacterium]|nr:hypothetical protein [Rhodospirillales bacterium]
MAEQDCDVGSIGNVCLTYNLEGHPHEIAVKHLVAAHIERGEDFEHLEAALEQNRSVVTQDLFDFVAGKYEEDFSDDPDYLYTLTLLTDINPELLPNLDEEDLFNIADYLIGTEIEPDDCFLFGSLKSRLAIQEDAPLDLAEVVARLHENWEGGSFTEQADLFLLIDAFSVADPGLAARLPQGVSDDLEEGMEPEV